VENSQVELLVPLADPGEIGERMKRTRKDSRQHFRVLEWLVE